VPIVRVATWNVEYARGAARNARRRDVVQSVEADIWVLTETHDEFTPGDDFQAVSTVQRPLESADVVPGSRWATIWSRFPIRPVDEPGPDDERTVAAVVDTPEGPVLVCGVVLPWIGDKTRDGVPAVMNRLVPYWSELKKTHGAPLVVAGDFNVNLGGPHYYGANASKDAVRSGLTDLGLEAVTDFERTRSHLPEHGLVDHIAVPSHLASGSSIARLWERHDADGLRLSDHHGVAVDVSLAGLSS
jgi:endonuclease/exonuclease/phosphatase family metal-dependent hydrolase